MARCVLATHIPRLPKKKPLRGKKVGFAEKNFAYRKQLGIVLIKGGISLPDGFTPQPTLRGSSLWLRLQAALRFRLACMELLTILACVVKHAVQRSLYGRLFCTNTRSPCHSR